MPNHVTHRVVVTGPSDTVALFKSTLLTTATEKDGDGTERPYTFFDFEALIPMPELVRQTESGSTVNDGLLILGRSEIIKDFGLPMSLQERVDLYLSYPWVKAAGVIDLDGLKSLLLARSPDCVEKAQRAVVAYETYGHTSWYDWSIENWGTKWNSYNFQMVSESEGRLEFLFDTAWSTPVPIFKALADRPELKKLCVAIHAFDEGWNFAFVGIIKDGCFLGQFVEVCEARYEEVYGRPAPRDE